MFTTALLIESRQEKRTNPSLYAPQALNDREEMSHYGCLIWASLAAHVQCRGLIYQVQREMETRPPFDYHILSFSTLRRHTQQSCNAELKQNYP